MKSPIETIIFGAIFSLGANSLLVAQSGNAWAEQWSRSKFGRPSPTEATSLNFVKQTSATSAFATGDAASPTNGQRVALSKCMEATEQVRMQASQMQAIRRPWGRGRVGYSKNDLVAISDYREELKQSLANLAVVHKEFLNGLSEAQVKSLEQPLRKLDHLQTELSFRMSEIVRDLKKADPGPDSTGITWDVDGLKRAVDKWRSEHRKIEKEMGFGPDQSSIDQGPRPTHGQRMTPITNRADNCRQRVAAVRSQSSVLS